MRKLSFPGKTGKIYALGIFLVCGLLLISAEECEDISMAEQEAAWARYQAAQSGSDQQAAWDQQQASQSGLSQQAAWDQQQAAQSGPGQATPAAGAPAAGTNPTVGDWQMAGGAPAAGGPTASGPSASQAPAGAQGNSGAQGQQQAGADSWQSGMAQVGGAGGGTAGGNASQSGAGTTPSGAGAGGTTPAGGNQSPAGTSTGANFLTSISGKDWKLSELRLQGKTIVLDRTKLNSDGAGDIFTMTVDGNRISGKAAPNRYNTVYQAGENNTLTLSPVVSTLMASSFDPERIQEHEYYQYLSKVKSWRVNQNKLELVTTDASNKEAVLVYVN